MKLHVKKGDNVKILTGKDKGKTGRITMVNLDNGRVVVDGANVIIKHSKAKSQQQQSSIQKMPGSIDASNVQIVCPSCNQPTRVAKTAVEGAAKQKFTRTCKKCNATLDVKAEKKPDKKAKKVKKDDKVEEVAAVEPKATTKPKAAPKKKANDSTTKDGVDSKNADGAIV